MNAREAVVCVYIAAFLAGLVGLVFLPKIVWQYLDLAGKVLIAFYVLIGFCAVLLAYWVDIDDIRLETLERQLASSQNRIHELEKPHGRTPNQELIRKLEEEKQE